MAAPIALDDLLTLCEDEETQIGSSRCSDTISSDIIVDEFPELALDDEEYTNYVDVDNAVRSDPFEPDKGVLAVVDDTKSSTRRRTELKRLAANGWQRDDPTEMVLGKRTLYTYRGPNGIVETSLKRVMNQIRLGLIVDAADIEELHEFTEQVSDSGLEQSSK
jgi:hypothetical protein